MAGGVWRVVGGRLPVDDALGAGGVDFCWSGWPLWGRRELALAPGVCMRHDWIYEVLEDLGTYAAGNGLPALARQVDEAMKIARAEIGAGEAMVDQSRRPPKGRAH